MAIYYPELFCDIGTQLKLKKGKELTIGEITITDSDSDVIVNDIIGYGFDLLAKGKLFRLLNSQMGEYFILPPKNNKTITRINKVYLNKKIIINDTIKFDIGDYFYYEKFQNHYVLYSKYRKILRLSIKVFQEYFN